jgi:hypothetical protein
MDEKTKKLLLDCVENNKHCEGLVSYVDCYELKKFINSLTKKRKINIIKK